MNIPANLLYSKSHEWVDKLGDDRARVGLTDFAQDQLGDLVFVNLPSEGDTVDCDQVFGDVESVKAVSDIYSPVTGTVAVVNEELLDTPELINKEPYGSWIVEISEITDFGELMDADTYTEFCANI